MHRGLMTESDNNRISLYFFLSFWISYLLLFPDFTGSCFQLDYLGHSRTFVSDSVIHHSTLFPESNFITLVVNSFQCMSGDTITAKCSNVEVNLAIGDLTQFYYHTVNVHVTRQTQRPNWATCKLSKHVTFNWMSISGCYTSNCEGRRHVSQLRKGSIML